jgi:uncharacterized protein YkwD
MLDVDASRAASPTMRHVELLLLLFACAGSPPTGAGSADPPVATTAATQPAPSASVAAVAPSATSPLAGTLLTLPEARRYMVQLVNRDRSTQGLPPVSLDEGAAQSAGQAHADDMAHLGYLGHWGSDGSVPEERVTRAGGADVDFENAYCVTDEKTRALYPAARFPPAEIERAEAMFFNEVPPNDGHRKTILGKWRKRVGIGIAMPRPQQNEIIVPCISQEFVDTYGTYEPLPQSIKLGATLHIAGTLSGDVKLGAVGLSRTDAPKPLATAELNKRRSYPLPEPYEMFWPHGYRTRIELKTTGQSFSVDVPVSDHGQRGLYEVSVWAQHPGEKDFTYVSLRTLRVE